MTKRAFPITPILAAFAWIAVGEVSAQMTPQPVKRARVTLIPPYSPTGQPVPLAPQARTPSPGVTSPAEVMVPGHPMPPPTGPPIKAGLLEWDSTSKSASVTLGTLQTSFKFLVANVSSEPITVTSVASSCGCTVAKLESMPWTIAPGSKGNIEVVMNLAGKRGINTKSLTINTDHGFKILTVCTDIQEPPAGVMNEAARARNLQIATANRQAVLHGECASCHSTPAIDKTGEELYQAACTICHEAEHRAPSVPDLKHLQKETNADFWRTWITSSEQGKLMPAFGIDHGGILTSVQIDSLVEYLTESIPPEKSPAPPSEPGR